MYPDAAVAAAQAVDGSFVTLFQTVAVYRALGSEIGAEPLADRFADQGAVIALPVVIQHEAPLLFRLRSVDPLQPDCMGLFAPPPHAPTVRPDLVIVPLLAFDRTGARLGQGGGFYDRTLEALRRTGDVFALGLGYSGQEIDVVPTSPWDQGLDGVVTEAGLRMFKRGK